MNKQKTSVNNIQTEDKNRRYGFFTMFALVVGVVIGAGIFFKNTTVMNSTNSTVLGLIVWVVISVVVLAMVISLMETTSSTAKSGETGTLGTWIGKFYGPKTSKITTWFFVLVYLPSTLAILIQYAVDQFGEGIIGWITQNGSYLFQSTANASWVYFLVVFGITILLTVILGYLCNKSKSWSENFQKGTLVVKIIPIAFIIAIFVVLAIAPGLRSAVNSTPNYSGTNAPLFNLWGTSKNSWSNGPSALTIGFILALPAVMFAFDGFIYAGALQNEAKSVHTFRRSLISGIIFIIVVYILFSWAIYALSNGSGYSIFSVLFNIFPNQPWLALIVDLIIGISILGGFNGFYVSTLRNISSLSEEHTVVDKNGWLLKRNKQGIPENSGKLLIIMTLIWVLVVTGLNALWTASDLYWQIAPWFNANTMNVSSINQAWSSVGNTWAYVDTGNVIWTMHATDGIAEIVVVVAFIVYAAIAFGGILNRSDRFNRVDVAVDPVKGYSFFAWFSVISIAIITVINLYALGVEATAAPIWVIDWFWTISCFALPLLAFWYYERVMKNTHHSIIEGKKEYIEAYRLLLTPEEYNLRKNNGDFKKSNNSIETKRVPVKVRINNGSITRIKK